VYYVSVKNSSGNYSYRG